MGNDRDVILMRKFRDGDITAFDEIVQRHKKGLLNFFYRMLGDRQKAEDLAQEVFYRLFRARTSYEPRASFNTFLYVIAYRHACSQMRKDRRARRTLSLDEAVVNRDGDATPLYEKVASPHGNPRRSAARHELAGAIREAVLALPADLRAPFILSGQQAMPYRDISRVLAIPEGTVKSRVYRAVRLLREHLRETRREW